MFDRHEILFLLLAYVAELVGTTSGVSSSTLFVPLARLLETVQITLVLTAFLHVAGNLTRVFIFGRSTEWSLVFKFGLPSLIFTGIGALYSDHFSGRIYSFVLGLFLVAMSIFLNFNKNEKLFVGRWLPYVAGSISGLLTGLLGSGGALRSLALSGFQLNPLSFVATSTVIDFGGDVLRLGIYLQKGYLNPQHYFYIPILVVIAIAANYQAEHWIKSLKSEKFKKIVLAFVFCMGWISIFSSFVKTD